MRTLIFSLLMLVLPVVSGSSDAPLQAAVLSESRVAITGTSTLNRFECEAGSVQGTGRFENGRAEARVTVPVKAFDCGKSRMNHDLREAMKASKNPEIRFELTDVEHVESEPGKAGRLRVTGYLTIAGETRTVAFEASAERREGGKYRARGRSELRMSDFGVTPPTALAGLIRAHDQIVVHFDLLASISNHEEISSTEAPSREQR